MGRTMAESISACEHWIEETLSNARESMQRWLRIPHFEEQPSTEFLIIFVALVIEVVFDFSGFDIAVLFISFLIEQTEINFGISVDQLNWRFT